MRKSVKALAASAVALGMMSAPSFAACTLVIPFDFGSSAISSTSAAYLQRLAQNYPDATISVTGHTDAVGSASSNEALSNQRVQAVLDALRGNGANPNVAVQAAQGESNLAVQTNAANAANRRVDLDVPECDPAIFEGLTGGTVVTGPVAGGVATQGTLVGGLGGSTVLTGLGIIAIGAILAGAVSSDGT